MATYRGVSKLEDGFLEGHVRDAPIPGRFVLASGPAGRPHDGAPAREGHPPRGARRQLADLPDHGRSGGVQAGGRLPGGARPGRPDPGALRPRVARARPLPSRHVSVQRTVSPSRHHLMKAVLPSPMSSRATTSVSAPFARFAPRILVGPAGLGKTAFARAAVEEAGLDVTALVEARQRPADGIPFAPPPHEGRLALADVEPGDNGARPGRPDPGALRPRVARARPLLAAVAGRLPRARGLGSPLEGGDGRVRRAGPAGRPHDGAPAREGHPPRGSRPSG
jgi:hypothetical protein